MAIGELAAASHERIPLDLDDAALPVELDAVGEDLSEPFFDELPADDWAALLGDLTVYWVAELGADWADELELTLNSQLTAVARWRSLAADGWEGLGPGAKRRWRGGLMGGWGVSVTYASTFLAALTVLVSTTACTEPPTRTGMSTGAPLALVAETCLSPATLPAAATQTWPSDPLPDWHRQAIVPDTLCTTAPGAWFASSPVGGFSDAAAATGGAVALLHSSGILRVDATGTLVQSIHLANASAGLQRFCPASQGGWFVLGHDKVYEPLGGTALLRVADSGEIPWTIPGQAGRYLEDCTPTADGGVVIAGAQDGGEAKSFAFWQYVSPQGVASPPVVWPGVGSINAALFRPDGSLCAGGGYWSGAAEGRQVMVACWQGTAQLWTRVVEEPALEDNVALSAWPDGRLLATIRTDRWGQFTATIVAIDADGAGVQTLVPRMVTGIFGNQGWRNGSDTLRAVQPLPCATVGDARRTVDSETAGSGESLVWERRSLSAVQPLVRLYARGGKHQASPTSALFGDYAFAMAALPRPDGSLWIVGSDYCSSWAAGQPPCGWVYRLPALTACPAGSAVPP